MKKCTIIVFILFSVCYSELMAQKGQSVFKLNRELKKIENLDSLLNNEIHVVNRLYERSLYYRMKMAYFSNQLKTEKEKPLRAQDLNFIKSHTNEFMNLRDSLYTYTNKYEKSMRISQYSLRKNNISELERTKAVMLSTACALVLYDNYLLGVVLMEQDYRVRRLANDSDLGFGVSPNLLRKVSKAANSTKNQKRILNGIKFLERREEMFADETDEQYIFLRDIIYASPSNDYLKRTDGNGLFRKKIRLTQIFLSDLVADISQNRLNGLSKFFGNTTGIVATRRGKMYRKSQLKEEILKELQPLDILLEKTPFRLTDKFIPGYFGHAAVWLGSGDELDILGVWNHGVVRKYHDEVAPDGDKQSKHGKLIVEALREGVQLSTLNHFLNVDDFVILRPKFPDSMSMELKKESLLLAFRQVGKEYDFNFDINTTETIVCSELAYICFPKIDWATEKLVGRHTISPDNIASLVWESDQIELISFYHKGVKCEDAEKEKLLKKLVMSEQ